MITEIEGKKYTLQGDNGETQTINFTEIPESELLLCLLDRVEFLINSDLISYEHEMFQGLAHTLDYYYRRKRRGEISDNIHK